MIVNIFSILGFSLQKFVTDAGLSLGQTLTDSILHNLYNQLGIASYLMDTPCQLALFTPSKDGWKRGLSFITFCVSHFEVFIVICKDVV